ncbi:hypothetical protein BU17DRAFT_88824 [Hysterangium stoloniferum]|nr:hypothetical protein BU17DRAFT_88824 [Hysterangium stoloniferum]
MEDTNSPATEQCSKAWCKRQLLPDAKYRICDHCRECDQQTKRAQRACNAEIKDRDMWAIGKKSKRPREDVVGDERTNIRQRIEGEEPYNPVSSEDEDDSSDSIEVFDKGEALFDSIRSKFRTRSDVVFKGVYEALDDPLVTAKQQVEMAAQEVWRVTGYRFTVKDHKKQKLGHRTRFWCSQDSACKKKSKISGDLNIKSCDNIGMTRLRTITVKIEHHAKHVHYVDVSLPLGAADIIQEHVEWLTPVAMVAKVQAAYPGVTAAQVHKAWTDMSQLFWHHDDLQLPSAKKLLEEFTDTVDIFLPNSIPDGVDIQCWGMRKIAVPLEGKIVEVGINATYNTNSKHLELYSIMAEYDNAGFPISYALLSTATSIEQGKRKKALTAWAVCLKDKYAVNPVFTHIDKDMAEIGMAKEVWKTKINLCWWHLRCAV